MANPSDAISVGPDSGGEVEIVESWSDKQRLSQFYKTAHAILKGKAHGSPSVGKLRTLLQKFLDAGGPQLYCYPNTDEYDAFRDLQLVCRDGWKTTSTRDKKWTADFVADKLALLLVLKGKVEGQRERQNKRASANNDLKRAFTQLKSAFDPCYKKYSEAAQWELNKTHKTPTLDYQRTGGRRQDHVLWDASKKDPTGCPVCTHVGSTMAVESQADVNRTNAGRRAAAEADGGDGKFEDISAEHACYCFLLNCQGASDGRGCWKCVDLAGKGELPTGDGTVCGFDCDICRCTCQCKFQEAKRQFIALGILKNKKKAAAKEKSGVKEEEAPPAETASRAFYSFLLSSMENHAITGAQQQGARSQGEVIQDAATSSALDVYRDGRFAGSLDTQRGLQGTIGPQTSNVTFRHGDGRTETMSYAQAMTAKKKQKKAPSLAAAKGAMTGRKRKEKPSNVPPDSNFVSNRNGTYTPPTVPYIPSGGNRKTRNRLSEHPLAFGGGGGDGGDGGGNPVGAAGGAVAAAGSGAASAGGGGAAAAGGADIPSTPPMSERVRKRAGRVVRDKEKTPGTRRHAAQIQRKLSENSPGMSSFVKDTVEENENFDSQQVFDECLDYNKMLG